MSSSAVTSPQQRYPNPMEPTVIENQGGLEHQLAALYQERELLEQAIGVSDATQLVAMVESMSAQLSSMYSERENSIPAEGAFSQQVMQAANALRGSLGNVEISIEGKSDGLNWRMRCRAN